MNVSSFSFSFPLTHSLVRKVYCAGFSAAQFRLPSGGGALINQPPTRLLYTLSFVSHTKSLARICFFFLKSGLFFAACFALSPKRIESFSRFIPRMTFRFKDLIFLLFLLRVRWKKISCLGIGSRRGLFSVLAVVVSDRHRK